MKLPLSTTYVTFMVAMGTSFSDRAWDSESAVYRVTGVLTVVGGWFMTALIAFSVAFVFANIIHYFHLFGMIGLVVFAVVVIRATGREHRDRVKEAEEVGIFNLSDPADAPTAICQTFEHTGRLLREIRESLDCTFEAFLDRDISELRRQRKKVRQVQRWINIIIANIFKTLRLIQREEAGVSFRYAQTVRRLQKLSDGYRDIVARAQDHVGNNHQGFLDEQVADLRRVRGCLDEILSTMERVLKQNGTVGYAEVAAQDERLNQLARELDESQVQRIQDNTSRTRLSILYYALIGNCKVISRQNLKLLRIFQDSFPLGPGACPAEEKEIGTSSGDSGDRCRAN
jgi:Na+/phosphate symporter